MESKAKSRPGEIGARRNIWAMPRRYTDRDLSGNAMEVSIGIGVTTLRLDPAGATLGRAM